MPPDEKMPLQWSWLLQNDIDEKYLIYGEKEIHTNMKKKLITWWLLEKKNTQWSLIFMLCLHPQGTWLSVEQICEQQISQQSHGEA